MEESTVALRWWSRPLPDWAEASFWGAGAAACTALYPASISLVVFPGPIWLAGLSAAIALVTFLVYVWFAVPLVAYSNEHLAPDKSLPRASARMRARTRSMLLGLSPTWSLAAVALAGILAAALASNVIISGGFSGFGLGPVEWGVASAFFAGAVLWVTRVLEIAPDVVPVWSARLAGGVPSPEGAPDAVVGPFSWRRLLVALGVVIALVSPHVALAVVQAQARVDEYGTWRFLQSSGTIELLNGFTVVVPEGWTGSLSEGRSVYAGSQDILLESADERVTVHIDVALPSDDPLWLDSKMRDELIDVPVAMGDWQGWAVLSTEGLPPDDDDFLFAPLDGSDGGHVLVTAHIETGHPLLESGDPGDIFGAVVELVGLAAPQTQQ